MDPVPPEPGGSGIPKAALHRLELARSSQRKSVLEFRPSRGAVDVGRIWEVFQDAVPASTHDKGCHKRRRQLGR